MTSPTQVENATTPPKNGRAPRGRFALGNPGGPGNPFNRETAAMRAAFIKVVGQGGVEALAARYFEMAMEGNIAAARLVLQYTIGKPKPASEPDRVDVDDWSLQREKSIDPDEMATAVDSVPVELAKTVVSAMVPEKIEKFFDQEAELKAERAREEAETAAEIAEIRRAYQAEQAAKVAAAPPTQTAENGRTPPSQTVENCRSAPMQTGFSAPRAPMPEPTADWNAFTQWLTSMTPPAERE